MWQRLPASLIPTVLEIDPFHGRTSARPGPRRKRGGVNEARRAVSCGTPPRVPASGQAPPSGAPGPPAAPTSLRPPKRASRRRVRPTREGRALFAAGGARSGLRCPAPRRNPRLSGGQRMVVKWARINETWYQAQSRRVVRLAPRQDLAGCIHHAKRVQAAYAAFDHGPPSHSSETSNPTYSPMITLLGAPIGAHTPQLRIIGSGRVTTGITLCIRVETTRRRRRVAA